jgi:hypothetical protein
VSPEFWRNFGILPEFGANVGQTFLESINISGVVEISGEVEIPLDPPDWVAVSSATY